MGSDEEDAIEYVKALLSYLPSNNLEDPPVLGDELDLEVTDLDRELDASVVDLGKIRRDQSPFRTKQDPGNPAADANGEVRMPNVNVLVETVDMREAQRSYEANLNMVSLTNRMVSRTIDILKA